MASFELRQFLDFTVLSIGKTHITVSSLIAVLIFIVAIYFLLKLIRKSIYRIRAFDEAKKFSAYTIIKICIIILSSILALEILGFSLSVLMAGSAALLVGLGLGLQNLFSDYISGIIILVDGTTKVGDVIEINGIVGTVHDIHIRSTTVLTRDDKYIILPNTDLTRHPIINWTHHNRHFSRFEITLGVDYGSDINLVMQLLVEAAKEDSGVLQKPEPFARFTDFADSSLKFTVLFWVSDVFRVEGVKSNIRKNIYEKFDRHNVSLAYPHMVLHPKKEDS